MSMTAFLANTLTQTESLQHSQEQAAGGIGLFMNANKLEYICFKSHPFLRGGPLKLVDKIRYIGRSVSLTESDLNMQLVKAWKALHGLSIIWNSDQSYKIKQYFFQAVVVSILLYGCTTWTLKKQKLQKNATSYI